jgi:hypothetical protein
MNSADVLIVAIAAIADLTLLLFLRRRRMRKDGSLRISAGLRFAMKTGRLKPARYRELEEPAAAESTMVPCSKPGFGWDSSRCPAPSIPTRI